MIPQQKAGSKLLRTTIDIISIGFGINAVMAFGTAFFFQAKLILRLRADSNSGIGIGDQNSFHANLNRFLAGKIYHDIRPGWGKAIAWTVLSVLALFGFGGLTEFLPKS